ncbi:Sec14p-like phosphatidylinositol transfer family protein [Zea mays]|uniref:Sec14p-like phosphatidylinositol transfer family protein n=1 Tax=Zea mays TaxID=4577 RepID=A0A1D6LAP8_MAIZE|nr:Sec14p-like phosphatidylinositol transfer family protein [Zea mays]
MFLKFLKWRREAAPGGSVPEEQVRRELSQDKLCMGGGDRAGRPILVAFAARHFSVGRDMAEFKSFVVYFFDKICARIPRGQEKFLCIVDLKGWGYSNCDVRAYIAAIEILQVYVHVNKVHTKKAAAPKIAKQESSDDDTSDETFESDEEPAKKPAAKPLAAVAKNGSKTVKQESSSDEDSSEDESDDDSDDGSDIVFNLLNRVYDDVGKRWSSLSDHKWDNANYLEPKQINRYLTRVTFGLFNAKPRGVIDFDDYRNKDEVSVLTEEFKTQLTIREDLFITTKVV